MRKTDLTISTRLGAFLGLVGMSAIAGVLVAAMVTPAIAVSGIAANSTIGVFEDIPDNLQIDNLAQKTVLYAKQGDQQVPFAEFFSQDREEVPWDAVSQYAKDAAIATEDPRYYEHGGVDVLSAARALAQNVLNKEVQSGASTITMQYVRNVLVQKAQNMVDSSDEATQAEGRKAFTEATQPDMPRKLKEMRMAIGVEKKYSKNEILLAYLNIANFGSRVYGIESAARYYFNVSAADLTLEQAASLIATVNAPEVFKIDNPDNLERNKERRDLLLRNMLKEQKITQEQYDVASAAAITPTITPSTSGCIQANPISAAYFCDYVKNEILTNAEFGDTAADRDALLKRGGLQVYTTLDLDIQANAAEQMRKQVPTTARFTKIGGSVVSREVKTGRIIAMAQNTDYGVAQDQPGVTEINYSADKAHGGSAGFQVGSTYKIFTLVDWLKSGKSIYQTVNASKTTWSASEFTRCGDNLAGSPDYKVTNDTNTGATSNQNVLAATVASVNSAFVAMASQLDLCDISKTATDMGAYNADKRDLSSFPSDVVGSGGNTVAPLQMATAFASVANQGTMCPPIAIDNTLLGPLYQTPLEHGADIVVYSLTKYVGGHSDLVAGGISGSERWLAPVRSLRNMMGTICDPNTSWMLLRSLETVELRMQRAAENAVKLCDFLKNHPKVEGLGFLGLLPEGPRKDVYLRHCKGPGSTFSLFIKGGEAESFRFLDSLRVAKLAVSLGGTETLASHPAAMTHLSVSEERRAALGITDNLVRISVGIEDADDLIADFSAALDAV